MSHTPRGPDAHAPEFLANRGSRTGRDRQNSPGSSDSESGDISLEDDLGLNSVRGLARRASAAIEDAASTDEALWVAMAEEITDEHAALRREREPLAARVRALQAEADAMKITGYATTSKREALALRQKNHVEQSPEFQALAAVDAREPHNEWGARFRDAEGNVFSFDA